MGTWGELKKGGRKGCYVGSREVKGKGEGREDACITNWIRRLRVRGLGTDKKTASEGGLATCATPGALLQT